MHVRAYLYIILLLLLCLSLPNLVSRTAFAQSCSTLPTNTGQVLSTVNLSSSGTFRVWSRIKAADTTNNSYWLQIDNTCGVIVGDTSNISSTWTWVDYKNGNTSDKIQFTLSAGSHVIKLIGREKNVGVDKLIITTDLSCTPTGTGSLCGTVVTPTIPKATNTPTPSLRPTNTPTPKATNTPTPTVRPTNTPMPTPTITPNTTVLVINLALHGIGRGGDNANPTGTGNMQPVHSQRTVTVDIYNTQNSLVLTKQALVSFDGTTGYFKGTLDIGKTFTAGLYMIKIKDSQHLRTSVPGFVTITAQQANTLPLTRMVTGDVNNDNAISILDYNIMMDCYSDLSPAKNCPNNNAVISDLNDDGFVNQVDYNIFIRELTNNRGQ